MPHDGSSELAAIIAPGASFALAGPSVKLDAAHLPVRGDLAHIRLAGKVFVPHYVVPIAHAVNGNGAALHAAGRAESDVIGQLATGTVFNVLDMAGVAPNAWAWGQVGEDGPVGYVPLAALHPLP
ncbi:SH3 domain-containing protein [Novosphingobium bradum]|uniref:SH3 domain-containing protein n=1 Tax=Novosphingobium bradum TaxID=1737444 RepID=A0ABV7INV7_9SPHN